MHRLHHRFRAMASPCEIQLDCADRPSGQAACLAAEQEVRRIEAKYSRYRADSVLSQINAQAGGEPVLVDPETAALLDFAQLLWRDSEGRFDPTSGVLRRLWDFRSGRVPSASDLAAVLPLVGWQQVRWQSPHVQLRHTGMELDFGGIGKEYAADRCAGLLLTLGQRSALINLGGDVRVTGAQHDGSPWHIGIRHPRRADAILASVPLSSGAVATSGDSERYFELDGRRYSHLLDARTGWPVASAQLASVWAPSCLVAGARTTCALLQGESGWQTLADTPFLWVAADASIRSHWSVAGVAPG